MPKLASYHGVILYLFTKGEVGRHNTPHVHVKHGGVIIAVIEIATGKILEGKMPPPVKRIAVQLVKAHPEELMEQWDKVQRGETPHEIKLKPEWRRIRVNPSPVRVKPRKGFPSILFHEWLGKNEVRLFFSDGKVVELKLPWVRSAKGVKVIRDGIGLVFLDGNDVSAITLHRMTGKVWFKGKTIR